MISSTHTWHTNTGAAVVGVLAGLVWLTALGCASTAGWVWLRDRTRPSPPPNPWTTRAAWTLATGFFATIGVLASGVAS